MKREQLAFVGLLAIFLWIIWSIFASRHIVDQPSLQPSATLAIQTPLPPHLKNLLAGFGGQVCSQACWHNIQLGKTTVAEAKDILNADPNITLLDGDKGCTVKWQIKVEGITWQGSICEAMNSQSTTFVKWLFFHAPIGLEDTKFTFLDAMNIFGTPVGAYCSSMTTHYEGGRYAASLFFQSGIEVVFQHTLPYDGLIYDPKMPISSIIFRDDVHNYYSLNSWQGFTDEGFASPVFPKRCSMIVE